MLQTRCDSFVVETNVHFPTDITLLYDAIRKILILSYRFCKKFNIPGWRQYTHYLKQMKKQMLILQRKKKSTSVFEEKKEELESAYQEYVENAEKIVEKAKEIVLPEREKQILNEFITHADRQIEQIIRRVIKKESIDHEEKIFSIFEPHTEWISKGKAGVPVELGLKVAVIEDTSGFILNHFVMQKKTDNQIAVSFLTETKKIFPNIHSCSFDKGFYSKENKQQLKEILTTLVLPKKGNLSTQEKAEEHSENFKKLRKKHAAVESAINALEVHGLDICRDKGLKGFKRYISCSIVGRNLQKLGAVIRKKEKKQQQLHLKKLQKQIVY